MTSECDASSSGENRPNDENIAVDEQNGRKHELSQHELAEILDAVEQAPLVLNEKWFLLSLGWFTKLTNAAKQGFPEDVPAIDNSKISERRNGKWFLAPSLVERMDFIAVPAKVFERLSECYGLVDNSRDIIERVVINSPIRKSLIIDIYPRVVKLCHARDRSKTYEMHLRNETLGQLRLRALQMMNLENTPMDRTRFYICHANDKLEALEISDANSLVEGVLNTDPTVIVDVSDASGKFFIGESSNGENEESNGSASPALYTRGVCGLQNLGNTCFMASAIQCLSNVPPITEYFLSDRYKSDLNEKNPLGTGGHLARAYGQLIHAMWSGRNASFVPRNFKTTIGRFAPRFSGYSQQDSQELLAFLLDGLHEDLNRIKQKPYLSDTEEDESLSQKELAERAWKAYRLRNDSLIVDKVHGQLKSTLVCPVCSKVSIKFDPFCFLSVPLPLKEKYMRQMITLIFNPSKKWAKFAMTINRRTTVEEAKAIIRSNLNAPNLLMELLVMEGDKVRLLESEALLMTDQRPREIYAVEQRPPSGTSLLVPVLVEDATSLRRLCLPLIVSVPLHARPDDLKKLVSEEIVPLVNGSFNRAETPLLPEKPISFKLMPPEGKPEELKLEWPNEIPLTDYRGLDLVEREVTAPNQVREVTLYDCLDLFTKEEELSEQDSWYCPRCKKHERASKKLDLWRLPEILIVHLKRFMYSRWSRDKIDTNIIIPRNDLRLTQWLANESHEEAVYDLIAVSHHMGGLGGGHYTATALNGEKWYDFNDSMVSACAPPCEPSAGRSPYVLFYRRRQPPSPAHSDANIEMEIDD